MGRWSIVLVFQERNSYFKVAKSPVELAVEVDRKEDEYISEMVRSGLATLLYQDRSKKDVNQNRKCLGQVFTFNISFNKKKTNKQYHQTRKVIITNC